MTLLNESMQLQDDFSPSNDHTASKKRVLLAYFFYSNSKLRNRIPRDRYFFKMNDPSKHDSSKWICAIAEWFFFLMIDRLMV